METKTVYVDYLAAVQGIIDSYESGELSDSVYMQLTTAIKEKSKIGSLGRRVCTLQDFLATVAHANFTDPWRAVRLWKRLGSSIVSGLITAANEE